MEYMEQSELRTVRLIDNISDIAFCFWYKFQLLVINLSA